MAKDYRASLWHPWWPFALLCLAASTEWLITDNWPQAGSTLASETIACGLAASVSFGLALKKQSRRPSEASLFSAALGGALVLIGPALGTLLQVPSLSPASLVLALALTPVVTAVAEGLSTASLWPGLAALVGLLLVLPEPSFSNPLNNVVLLLAPLLTGVGCVLFRRSVAPTSGPWSSAAAFASAGVVFGIAAATQAIRQHAIPALPPAAVAIDFVLALLTILALQRLTASQYIARYVLVPLAVLLQGLFLLHSVTTARSVACGVLLAGAAVSLLLSRSEKNSAEPPKIMTG
ncbi:MAG TPA: hypothetical protein VGG18_06595 [Granulicella sp.]